MENKKPISILLVEDDESACEIIRSMLAMLYPQLLIYNAGDGQVGLELFRMHLPDIVITDIYMPKMDGVEMLGNMTSIKPDSRVIVVSAQNNRNDIEKIFPIDYLVEFVPKPID